MSEGQRQAISGYGYHSSADSSVIDSNRLTTFWNEWPTLEESFGATLQPERAQPIQWAQILSTAPPIEPTPGLQLSSDPEMLLSLGQWTTSFWNNVNKLSEIDDIQSTDINNNAMDWRYDTKAMVSSNQCLEFNNEWQMAYRRAQPPIGTRIRRKQLNESNSSVQQSLDTTLNEESLFHLSKMSKSWYIQPKIRRRLPSAMECVFCKNNNERPEFYRSHILKDPESNIQCPVLRAYDCPICHNGGGPKAHTIRYCPLNKAGFQSKLEKLLRSQTMNSLIPEWSDIKKKRKVQKIGN